MELVFLGICPKLGRYYTFYGLVNNTGKTVVDGMTFPRSVTSRLKPIHNNYYHNMSLGFCPTHARQKLNSEIN